MRNYLGVCCAFLFLLVACGGQEIVYEGEIISMESVREGEEMEPEVIEEVVEVEEIEMEPEVVLEEVPYFDPDPNFPPTCDTSQVDHERVTRYMETFGLYAYYYSDALDLR